MRLYGRTMLLPVSMLTALLAARVVDAATCPRTATALTSSCESTCFTGRPCVAFSADDSAGCVDNAPLVTCKKNANSGCTYACLKYGTADNVERNIIDFTAFTFLIPFGTFKSEYEAKWSAAKNATVDATVFPNQTDQFPSVSDDLVATIEPLTFLTSTKTLRVAGGSSVDGIQGRIADVALKPTVFAGATGLLSLTVANLDLKEILPSSLPAQLVNFTLSNCAIGTIPNDLLTMTTLDRLDLSKNYLKSYPVKYSMPSVTYLNLSTNNIDTFEGGFTGLTTLDLSNNLLTSVPTSIFDMSTLKSLDLSRNSFANVKLTPEQAAFLSNISSLTVDSFGAASCGTADQKTVGGAVVCVKSGGASSSGGNGTTTTDDTTTSGGNSHSAALIGGIIGGIVAVVAVVAIVVFLRRRKNKSVGKQLSQTITPGNLGGSTASGQGPESVSSLWSDQELQSLKLNSDDIEDVRKIGSGAFSNVFLVKYRQTRLAASKRLKKDDLSWHHTQQFVSEIKLVKKFEHPRIVSLIGVAWTIEADLQALFEFMENGDLRTYLEMPSTPRRWTREKLQIIMDIIEALVYVHSFTPPLVHRDLKSRNVLLDKENRAKLSDFGVARFRSEEHTMTTGVGTGRWLAPEVISGSNDYDQSSDIFAFGVVMSELDTHELPYEDIRGPSGNRLADVALLQMVSVGKLVPTFSRACPSDILKLASRCLAFDRNARPTAVEVAYALRTIIRSNEQLK